MKTKIVLILISVWFIGTSFHPFYLSVSEVVFLAKEKKVTLSIKCFTNDLEDAMRKVYATSVDLSANQQFEKNKQLLFDYHTKRFSCINGKNKINFTIIGYENEQDVTWSYFEARFKPNFSDSIKINNRLLFDYLPSQTNITHIKGCGNIRSTKNTNPNCCSSVLLNCQYR
jgi:hypothetical protein